MGIVDGVRRVVRKTGFDVVRFPHQPELHRRRLFDTLGLDLVLDVGANIGQFGTKLRREVGYSGRIVSFEPMALAFSALVRRAAGDPLWEARNHALGDREGEAEIHVAGNSYSSSLLPMLPAHLEAEPGSRYVASETIRVKRLDDLFEELRGGSKAVLLKLDVQGFEKQVLDGAAASLPHIVAVQMEMALVPLYAGEILFRDHWARMEALGYRLVSVEPAFNDPRTGRLLQVDGIFTRTEGSSPGS